MNLGIQDANNILWKLAWAKRIMDNASSEEEKAAAAASVDIILGSYHTERHALGQNLVQSVQKATGVLATKNPFMRFLRNMVIWIIASRDGTQNNFRKAGQLELAYPAESSAIIIESVKASKNIICSPGQRLPNIRLSDGTHLHSHIDRVNHTWVFLNDASGASVSDGQVSYQKIVHVTASAKQVSVPIISKQALTAQQVILVRPDLFVAGIGETRQELLDGLKGGGLNDKALSMM
jgi:hypothetical protein